MTYQELKARHTTELNKFPIEFAFSEQQLKEALSRLGTTRENVRAIGSGGIIRKADYPLFVGMFDRHENECEEAYKDDTFLLGALIYELNNHEYRVTHNAEDALRALNLVIDDYRKRSLLKQAVEQVLSEEID
jgi:hypothetical protein